jgi:GNAT superfamily N-acetyltransferase
MDVTIVPLDGATWPALATLFEEGGDPRWCWCMFWRVRGTDYSRSTAEANRSSLHALIGRDPAPGLVALDADDRAVGWVSLGPREDFERLERSRVRPRLDRVPVWSIVCFVVSRRSRRKGLEAMLLDAAIAYARAQGAPALEAYPVDSSEGKPTAATLYTGTLSTFRRAGFEVAQEIDSPQATVTRTIVRLALDPEPKTRWSTPPGESVVDTPGRTRLDSPSGARTAPNVQLTGGDSE